MFTGLIEKVSKINDIKINNDGAIISFKVDFEDIKVGSSIALNGVCLTVVKIEKDLFFAQIMKETLNLTNLKYLKKGDLVNLERAMSINSRFDGHIIQGHIDCVAILNQIIQDGFSKRLRFKSQNDLIIKKGSIAINGVSLTVSEILQDGFEVCLIPQTLKETNLNYLNSGDKVNIEFDVLGKYIKSFIQKKEDKFSITKEFLIENGF